MVGLLVENSKDDVAVITPTLLYDAPPILAISLLIYNIVWQAWHCSLLRWGTTESSILGLGKWTGEDDLSLHKQIIFMAHAERWGGFAITKKPSFNNWGKCD